MSLKSDQQLVIISAPSGSGKTTIVKALSKFYPKLSFSISATTRQRRENEVHAKDYYFISEEEFKQKRDQTMFLEFQMVYTGTYYGTLIAELNRIWNDEKIPLLEIDVEGAIKIKSQDNNYKILSIFIEPPSIEILEKRLRSRGTESKDTLVQRIQKAKNELLYKDHFHYCVKNDDLEKCISAVSEIVGAWIIKNNHKIK